MGALAGHVRIISLPSIANAFTYIGPFGFLEYNFEVLAIPWNIVSTFTGGFGNTGTDDVPVNTVSTPHPPVDTDDWDILFRRLLLEFGTDGNEYYGANPDDKAEYDALRNIWFRRRGAVSQTADTTPGSGTNPGNTPATPGTDVPQDEPLMLPTMGPMGIQRLYSAERILKAESTDTLGKSIPGLSGFFKTAGLNDLVYADTIDWTAEGPTGSGYFILAGVVRYHVGEATPSFATTWGDGTSELGASRKLTAGQHAAKLRALNMLLGHDQERVQAEIRYDTGFLGDYLRSVLFAGDNMIEPVKALEDALGFDSSSPYWETYGVDGWYRMNDIVVAQKLRGHILTPYTMRVS